MTRHLIALSLLAPSLLLACAGESDDDFEPVAAGELEVAAAEMPTAVSVTDVWTIPPNSMAPVSVGCPANTIVTDGLLANGNELFVFGSRQVGNGWQLFAKNSSNVAKTISSRAICLGGVNGDSTLVANSVSVPAGATGCVTATCTLSVALGGGYSVSAVGNNLVYASQPTSGNGWLTCSKNVGADSTVLTSYATCLMNPTVQISRVKSAVVSVAPGAYGYAASACPVGTVVVGGGYRMTAGRWTVTKLSSSGTQYFARARNLSNIEGFMYVTADCLSET